MNRRLIDRRTLLRGASLSLGLPLLEAMTPIARSVFAAPDTAGLGGSSPVRMACMFFPNGAIMENWKPTAEGDSWSLSKTLAPLLEEREDRKPHPWPDRYRSLAIKALRRGEMSIGRFAEYLNIRRQEAMRYVEQEVPDGEEVQVTSA